eukprot:1826913-Lingulodinium_polyedra.AAC.1
MGFDSLKAKLTAIGIEHSTFTHVKQKATFVTKAAEAMLQTERADETSRVADAQRKVAEMLDGPPVDSATASAVNAALAAIQGGPSDSFVVAFPPANSKAGITARHSAQLLAKTMHCALMDKYLQAVKTKCVDSLLTEKASLAHVKRKRGTSAMVQSGKMKSIFAKASDLQALRFAM